MSEAHLMRIKMFLIKEQMNLAFMGMHAMLEYVKLKEDIKGVIHEITDMHQIDVDQRMILTQHLIYIDQRIANRHAIITTSSEHHDDSVISEMILSSKSDLDKIKF